MTMMLNMLLKMGSDQLQTAARYTTTLFDGLDRAATAQAEAAKNALDANIVSWQKILEQDAAISPQHWPVVWKECVEVAQANNARQSRDATRSLVGVALQTQKDLVQLAAERFTVLSRDVKEGVAGFTDNMQRVTEDAARSALSSAQIPIDQATVTSRPEKKAA